MLLKRLIVPAMVLLLCPYIVSAQDDADIPAKFKNLIDESTYQKLRDDFLNLLRGLPADPGLRDAAVQQMQSAQRVVTLNAVNRGIVASIPTWTPLGPSPIPNGQVIGSLAVTGRATAFQIDPTNSNKIYLGTAQGGVYRSLDGGTTWAPIFDTAASSAIGALALAPSSPTTLFVGTGEANLSGDSYAGVGLYRIDNADTTATLVGPINPARNYIDLSNNAQSWPVFNGRSISTIAVHPTDASIVFVGTATGVIGSGGDAPLGSTPPRGLLGLYKLTNATSAASSVAVQKITVTTTASADNPNTGNRAVYSAVFDPSNINNMLIWVYGNAAANDGGMYRSTNILSGSPTFTQTRAAVTSGARAQIVMYAQASAPNVVAYAATGETFSGASGGVIQSIDGGVTWSTLAGGKGFCGGQCFYNIALDVLPGATASISDDVLVLGGNTPGSTSILFAKSVNGGATFTESSSGLHADTHFIRIDPNNNSTIYHGDDGGIFKSTSGGNTWSTLNTVPINSVQFSGIAVHPTDAKWSIGGTQDNGTNMRKSDGTWIRADYGDGGYALVDKNATDTTNMTLYHTYFNQTGNLIGFGRILSTACASDGGWSFKGIYSGSRYTGANCDSTDTFNGIALSDPVLFYAPMELGPGTPNTIYFGAGKVYRSADRGESMTVVSQADATYAVSSIAVSPQDDGYRLFGRNNGTLFYTTTGSNPMTALTGIPAKFVGRVKFDPSNKNTAYVGLGGYFGGTSTAQSHVWKVTNLSGTPVVTGINNGLPDVPVNAFAVDPANGNNLFAGTDVGVYASTNGGANWAPYGTGLPVVAVFGMEIQPQARLLRIGTHGRGAWDISLPTIVSSTTVTNVTSTTSDGSFKAGASISIQVTFSSVVTVTGTPTLSLNSGGTASYVSGSGTSTLTFSYTVAAGQNSADLDYTSVNALSLNGGTITDSSSNAVVLTLPAPGTTGSLGFNKNIVIDTVAPTVVSYSVLFGSQSFNMSGSTRNRLPWTVTGVRVVFSEPVTASAASLSGLSATGITGSGTNTVTWSLAAISNLPSTLTKILGTSGNAVVDAAGNPLGGGVDFSQALKILYCDYTDDGSVNSADQLGVNSARTKPYNVFADVNGDGVVDPNDVNAVRSQVGKSNP